jgi:transcriptional regulator with XRE-family HTH domain
MSKTISPQQTVAEFLADRIAAVDKTQKQIASECGFDNANVITMFKNGSTKLPIGRIALLAKAIEVDPIHLLRLVMLEYIPDLWESIETIMQNTVLTANELQLVQAYREVNGGGDDVAVVIEGYKIVAIVTTKAELHNV